MLYPFEEDMGVSFALNLIASLKMLTVPMEVSPAYWWMLVGCSSRYALQPKIQLHARPLCVLTKRMDA